MIKIPREFMSVRYVGKCYPGATGVVGIKDGANCQQFAYELLRHFGRRVPDLSPAIYGLRILAQCEVPVLRSDTVETLAARVLEREHTFLVETLSGVVDGRIELRGRS